MTSETLNEVGPPADYSQSGRCYSEECDYLLDALGKEAWLTGCPLCGGQCWADVPKERRDKIDAMLGADNSME
jgi:predicted  nucleic acid-binding Zn-ribbon protein